MTQYMTQWKSTREPPKTKAELRKMLAEAVRNTQAENERLHSGHGSPRVEIERPRPIISELKITAERVPTRSAIRAMTMPPVPVPNRPAHWLALERSVTRLFVGDVLQRYRSDPRSPKRHPKDEERRRGDGPGGFGLNGS